MPLAAGAPAIVVRAVLVGPHGHEENLVLIVDTGAGNTIISRQALLDAGYAPDTTRRLPMLTATGVQEVPVITVQAIDVLGVRVPSVDVVAHSLPPETGADGVLGLSFLRHTILTLDYKDGVLRLADP